MSIEALLIAAKYVELTDEPTDGKANTVSDVETRSQPSASNDAGRRNVTLDKRGLDQDDSDVSLKRRATNKGVAVEGNPVIVTENVKAVKEKHNEEHVSPSSHHLDYEMRISSQQHDVTDSTMKEQTTDPDVEAATSVPSSVQTASVPPEQSQQIVVRHPGYDVSWSYYPPPSLPSKPQVDLPPDGNPAAQSSDKSNGKIDETNLEEDEEGKKSGVREVHNKLEKNRRAHLKECFDALKGQIPTLQDRKVKISNSNILSGACRYIGALKRKEKELEHELDRLVREKIQKQKLLQRLKIEKSKDLHRGMAWHQQSSVITSDLVNSTHTEPEDRVHRDHDEEDRYSTSTASETEEEERKSQELRAGMSSSSSSAVTAVSSMTVTVTSSTAGSCETSQQSSVSLPSGSYRHPLKSHLLREHRAQLAREAATAATVTTTEPSRTTLNMAPALNIVKPINSVVTVVPNMPISPNARATVSQLLGKQTVPIRQPVRKQAPSHSLSTVLQPTSIPIQRFQGPGQSFVRPSGGEIALRPSSTQPVVTIGVTQALQSRSDLTPLGIKLPHRQILPVNPQGIKLQNGQVVHSSPTSLNQSLSIVSSLPSSFLHASIPGATSTLNQPLGSPIALSTPVTQVFLTHPKLAGYTSLPPSMLSPFVSTSQTVVSPLLTSINQTRPQATLLPNNIPLSHPQMSLKTTTNSRSSGANVHLTTENIASSAGNLQLSSSMFSHQIGALSSSTAPSVGNAHHQNPSAVSKSKSHKGDKVRSSSRSKPLITTSQIAQTLLANGGMSKVKTVTAGSGKSQSTVAQSLVTLS